MHLKFQYDLIDKLEILNLIKFSQIFDLLKIYSEALELRHGSKSLQVLVHNFSEKILVLHLEEMLLPPVSDLGVGNSNER